MLFTVVVILLSVTHPTDCAIGYARAVKAWTFSNVLAGSDSTGVVLKTIWYNLLRYPNTLDTLRLELHSAGIHSASASFPRYSDLRELAYLDAVVNEGVRLHPPFCLPFERIVPSGGMEICGRWIPGGTVVGISPWVVNRHKGTFGEDAESWRPGRWVEADGERRKRMDGAILTVSDDKFPLRLLKFDSALLTELSVWGGPSCLHRQMDCNARNQEAGRRTSVELRGQLMFSMIY